MITQEILSRFHNKKNPWSFLLFDEIEKSAPALWQLMLGILDYATMRSGDNTTVDFCKTFIGMTSNVGALEMSTLVEGGLGFTPTEVVGTCLDSKLKKVAIERLKKKFSPEFINRIDDFLVFKSLRPEHMQEILDIELGQVQKRILVSAPERGFLMSCTPMVKALLLREGTAAQYGARPLKRVIERRIVAPLSALLSTNQISPGDYIRVDLDAKGEMEFITETSNSIKQVFGADTPAKPSRVKSKVKAAGV
jgi:ATP-dependent Clp protease ATP-binding subunit ClpA